MESIIKQALNRNQMQEESAISGANETLMSEQKQEAPRFKEQPQMIQQQERIVEQPQLVQKHEAKIDSDIVGAENIPIEEKTSIQDQKLEQMLIENEAKISVIGIGGMGSNAINRLSTIGIQGATTIALNTDIKHLKTISADKRILIGAQLTRGLGAGGFPDVGKQAAEETISNVKKEIGDADMLFIVAGMGGGTGTGAAPTIAESAKQKGTIVIGVTTMPFKIEGSRMEKAEYGLNKLRQSCDTVIVIENDKLNHIAGNLPLEQAFAVGDELIVTMIKGITETISTPSLVNLDYADVKAIMKHGGVAMIGIAESTSKSRAEEAVKEAMQHPLLDVDYSTATGALIHITGGHDMRLDEITTIGSYVQNRLDSSAQTVWGARVEEGMEGKIQVITIITGVNSPYILGPRAAKQEEAQKIGSMKNILNIDYVS
ncbi:MAG: cell division protein FtsZ [Candidatus Nanohalarchaeota archaeon]|nr:MAG: cell division protein FtsZ [Candidatus Nanohaloarchaeota archaeon]